jgi:hypothetical protein
MERFEGKWGGKAQFTWMNARSGSWEPKREGMKGVKMKENGNLCKTRPIGRGE